MLGMIALSLVEHITFHDVGSCSPGLVAIGLCIAGDVYVQLANLVAM